jgi:serine/threonine protein phosphatase PrpC
MKLVDWDVERRRVVLICRALSIDSTWDVLSQVRVVHDCQGRIALEEQIVLLVQCSSWAERLLGYTGILFSKNERRGGIRALFARNGQGSSCSENVLFEKTKGRKSMPVDMNLLLKNVRIAFANGQREPGMLLLNYAIRLADEGLSPLRLPLDTAIALDPGMVRQNNEDCVLAVQGTLSQTSDVFGLFIVCDGMGGHTHGLDAAHLAIETIAESVLPYFVEGAAPADDWMQVLVEAVQAANRAIYLRNQSETQTSQGRMSREHARERDTAPMNLMGTTVTAALLLRNTFSVVSVGDSRAYLYRPHEGLVRITLDHSWVATLYDLAHQRLTPEGIYTHPQRNQIFRALGVQATVELDTFVVDLSPDAVLLLCSDGLWEMTRDLKIEEVMSGEYSAPYLAHRLLELAKEGGARDNISFIVVQDRRRSQHLDISAQETLVDPVAGLTRLVS